MSRTTRIGALVVALVALVVAFVLLRPSDEKKSTSATETSRTIVATTTTRQGTTSRTTTTVVRKPAQDPGPLLTAKKITNINVAGGDTVRFRVRSDTPEEVHIHGYDIKRDLPAGTTASVQFKATIEGGFRIELEGSGTQIGELTVEP